MPRKGRARRTTPPPDGGGELPPLRICFVNALYSDRLRRGGLGSHIADVSAALAAQGHEVTIVTAGLGGRYREGRVEVVELGPVPAFSRSLQLLNPRYLSRRLAYMWRMTRHVRAAGYDVVEAAEGGFEHLFLGWSRTCALVCKLHGTFRHIHGRRPGWRLVDRLERLATVRSDGLYTSTRAYAAAVAGAWKLPLERIAIIPYGIDVAALAHVEPRHLDREVPAIRGKRVVFCTVGNAPERKGARVFVDAARQLAGEDVAFVISCTARSVLARLSLPEDVVVLEGLGRPEFHQWLVRSDVVAFPSSFESFSIAMHEAMLLGRPILVSADIPLEGVDLDYPLRRVLETSSGSSIARGVREILAEPAEDPLLPGLLARLRAHYDLRRVADLTAELYRAVALRAGSPQRALRIARKSST